MRSPNTGDGHYHRRAISMISRTTNATGGARDQNYQRNRETPLCAGVMQLADAVPVESSSIAIPVRHTGSVRETTDFHCAVSHRFPTATPLCLRSQKPIEKGTLMSGGWILLGLAVFGVIAKAIGWFYARGQRSDLGRVSRRWLAEQHFER
jgi:hypothetical protein